MALWPARLTSSQVGAGILMAGLRGAGMAAGGMQIGEQQRSRTVLQHPTAGGQQACGREQPAAHVA
jgi:hypothetical protein